MDREKRFIPILDNGHGGVIGGEYQTAGKRSPNWKHGVLYEGMFNRWVVNHLAEKLDRAQIPYYKVSEESRDVSLEERVERVNKIIRDVPNGMLLSVHANAGGGSGMEFFTTQGVTTSDLICNEFIKEAIKAVPNHKLREDLSDGDSDKEANFYILSRVACPAVLVEVAFMDNEKDYEKLWDKSFLEDFVEGLYAAIYTLYYHGITV